MIKKKTIEWYKIEDTEIDNTDELDNNEENQSLTDTYFGEMDVGHPIKGFIYYPTSIGLGGSKIIDWLYPRLDKWEMHANFRITEDMIKNIDKNGEGVEAIMPLTPYRCMVAIGKMFYPEDVQLSVKNAINSILEEDGSIASEIAGEQ